MEPMQVEIKHLKLKSPLMTASGTAGHSGKEINKLVMSSQIKASLGAFVTKGITLKPCAGNPEFRIVETRTGLLNSIGLQNEGVSYFMENELPGLLNFELPVIVNISGQSVREFEKVASYLSDNDFSEVISGIEINVSCPNIKKGGIAFGTDPRMVERIVRIIKKRIHPHILLITKLTPNVTDITLPARAAIEGGTDAISMINTLRGMAINVDTGEPLLGTKTGGLSGPAIKPVGVFMVYECFEKILECHSREIPIIGIGGITNWRDALEYIMAGATAVGIGTAYFVNPNIFPDIYQDVQAYLKKSDLKIMDLIGKAHDATGPIHC
jgi:dihydroorotate dehydrogenase (NAD+) catalytic subunit